MEQAGDDFITFRQPEEGGLFAGLKAMYDTLRGAPGAAPEINARDLYVEAVPPTVNLLSLIKELWLPTVRMTEQTVDYVSGNSETAYVYQQLLVENGIVPNLEPLCPCGDAEHPRPLRVSMMGGKGGKVKADEKKRRAEAAEKEAKANRLRQVHEAQARVNAELDRLQETFQPGGPRRSARQAHGRVALAKQSLAQAATDTAAVKNGLEQGAAAARAPVQNTPPPAEPDYMYGKSGRLKYRMRWK